MNNESEEKDMVLKIYSNLTNNTQVEQVKKEFEVMKQLEDDAHIVQVHKYFPNRSQMLVFGSEEVPLKATTVAPFAFPPKPVVAMELCEHGDLLKIVQDGLLTEDRLIKHLFW